MSATRFSPLLAGLGIAALVALAPLPTRAQAPQAVTGAQTLDSDGVIALVEKAANLVIIDARHEKD